MNKNDISIIIPAFNEESHIGGVIDSIEENCEGRFNYEIIVIDNGSNDRTVSIAKSKGACVFLKPSVTISALRNIGVCNAKGKIFVFIDADVFLKATWGEKLFPVLEILENDPMAITGSTYGLREKPSWVEWCWYEPVLSKENINYINGGHLITTRVLFKEVGGFNERLETGEDYDFCLRAKRIGAKIINNPALEVVHEGYPKTLTKFFQRERWHGRGDYVSFRTIFSSKPAIFSLSQFGIMIISLILAIIFNNLIFVLIYISYIGILCSWVSFNRCGGFNLYFPGCAILYALYFFARSFAFFDVMLKKRSNYHTEKAEY